MAAVVVGNPLSIWWMWVELSRVMRETSGRDGSYAFFHPQPSIRISTTFFALAPLPPSSSSGKRGREVLPVSRYSKVPGRFRNDRTCEGGANLSWAGSARGG